MYQEIFASDPFTFIVGKEQKRVIAHAEAIARLSRPLGQLIRGPMKEGQAKCAQLEDIQPEDFIRFCQFAYTGDYAPARPARKDSEPKPKGDENAPDTKPSGSGERAASPEMSDSASLISVTSVSVSGLQGSEAMFGIGINLDEEKKKTDAWLLKGSQGKDPVDSKLEELRERFGLTVFKANRAKNALKRLCRPFGNKNPDEDFAPVLLCHAQLYVFGDKYDIKNLRWLALEKLRATLVSFQLHEQRVQDVVQLVRYAYGNTAACPMEPLRDMLAQYLAGRIKVIGSNEAFHVLLKEGGEFVTDFWGQILAQVLS